MSRPNLNKSQNLAFYSAGLSSDELKFVQFNAIILTFNFIRIVPTALQTLPAEHQSKQLIVDSSKTEGIEFRNAVGTKQRRFFGQTLTSVLKTDYVSTLLSPVYNTASVIGLTNLLCLPPGLVVCK